jgi:hypothetical protein
MRSLVSRSGHMARWLWHDMRQLLGVCDDLVMRICDLEWSLWNICCMCLVWSCSVPLLMRGKLLWKTLHFHHGYVTCLYVSLYVVCDACAQIEAILLLYVSILACCSALSIFEKHMLAFVDVIHALPTRGRKVLNSCFQGELAFMHLGALFRLNFSCALLPMVSSPFASSWGVRNFGEFYLGCVEPLPLP